LKKNGIWVENEDVLVDYVAEYITNYLHDTLKDIIEEPTDFEQYSDVMFQTNTLKSFQNIFNQRTKIFEDFLVKYKKTVKND